MAQSAGYTKVVENAGAVPVLTCTDLKTVAKHKKIADDFRAAHEAALERSKQYPFSDFIKRKWISNRADWFHARDHWNLLRKAVNGKTGARIKQLEKCFV